MKIFHSVKFKIFFLISTMFSIFIFINNYYHLYEKKRHLYEYMDNLNQSSARLIEKNINSDLYTLNYTAVKETLKGFDNDYFEDIYILNNSGYIFARRNSDEIIFEKYKNFLQIQKDSLKDKNIYYKQIKLSQKRLGYIVILNDQNVIKDLERENVSVFIYEFFVSLATILIISYIISLIITRPINNMIKIIKNSDEKIPLKIDNNYSGEFGYLSKTIEENYKKLHDLNINLENRVDDAVKNIKQKDILLQKQAIRASLGDMMDMVAHQWKQPLSIINLRVQSLAILSGYHEITEKDLNKAANDVNLQVNHLVETLDEFRGFFRDNKTNKKTELNEIIKSTLLLIKSDIEANDIEIDLIGDEQIKVNIIPEEFKHIILNIVGNSKDAFKENDIQHRKIDFVFTKKDDDCILKISDNAGGVAANIIDNIFEPNFTTKEEGKGTGIGLYMVKIFLDKINGTISAKSIPKGILFTITIPLA